MQDKSTIQYNKVKPRDFDAQAKILTQLGASKYDSLSDVNELTLHIEETMKAQKVQWKTLDETELKAKIKRQLIYELTRIEERKQVRRDQKEIQKKKEEQRDIEADN